MTLLATTHGPLLKQPWWKEGEAAHEAFPPKASGPSSPSSPVPSVRTSRVPGVYGASKGRLGMEAYFHSDVMSALQTGLGQIISKV